MGYCCDINMACFGSDRYEFTGFVRAWSQCSLKLIMIKKQRTTSHIKSSELLKTLKICQKVLTISKTMPTLYYCIHKRSHNQTEPSSVFLGTELLQIVCKNCSKSIQ